MFLTIGGGMVFLTSFGKSYLPGEVHNRFAVGETTVEIFATVLMMNEMPGAPLTAKTIHLVPLTAA